LRRLRPDSALIQEVKTLTRDQESLLVSQRRLVHQLPACLKTYYPVALTLFEPAPAACQRSLSSKPTRLPRLPSKLRLQEITLVLQQAKHRRLARVGQRIWEQLQQPSDAA
jgi:hypothetical protein